MRKNLAVSREGKKTQRAWAAVQGGQGGVVCTYLRPSTSGQLLSSRPIAYLPSVGLGDVGSDSEWAARAAEIRHQA